MTKRLVTTVQILLLALTATMVGCLGSGDEGDEELSTIESELITVAPTGVTATVTSSTRVTVSWNAVPTATKYYVWRSNTGPAGTYFFQGTARAPSTSLAVANLTPNTQYCFTVSAEDVPGGQGPRSSPPACATPSAGTVPTAPTGVTATATASTRITVAWTAVATATKYYVYQSAPGGAGPYTFAASVLSPTVTANIANLQTNTVYCYQVQAENTAGVGPFSSPPACARTFIEGLEGYWKLNEASGTNAKDFSGQMRDGTATGNITRNNVDRAPLDNDPYSLSVGGAAGDAVNIPHQTPFNLTGNFTVAFWTKIANAAGTYRFIGKRAAGCAGVNWEIGQDAMGLHIIGQTRVNFGANVPADQWTHVAVTQTAGAATFYVNGTQVGTGAVTVGTRNADPLQLGNSGGCGSSAHLLDEMQVYSTGLTSEQVARIGKIPDPPTTVTATALSSSSIDVSWSAVPSSFKYFLYKGSSAANLAFGWSIIAPTTQFRDNANAASTTVFYGVRSVRDGLISNFGPVASTMTMPPPPPVTGVSASASGTRITVNWAAHPTATKYYVYISSSMAGPFTFRGTTLAPGTSYVAASLAANTTYYFVVRAETPSGVTMDSAVVSATTGT